MRSHTVSRSPSNPSPLPLPQAAGESMKPQSWRGFSRCDSEVLLFTHYAVSYSATPGTVACRAPQPMELPRQEYWSGLPFCSPGDLPNPGTEPSSPALQADSLPSKLPGKPLYWLKQAKWQGNTHTHTPISKKDRK